jgi:3'(2'), 5'-bisphosphate nucleotidase
MNILSPNYSIAIQAAIDASFVVMKYYESNFSSENKEDGSPVTEADQASSDLIHLRLQVTQIPIIGEEIKNLPFEERNLWKENWCVDPLDGTKEFIKKNGEFVINIAHVVSGKPTFGIIVSPVLKKIIVGGPSTGVWINTFNEKGTLQTWQEVSSKTTLNNPMVLVSSRSFHSPKTEQFVQELREKYGELIYLEKGSALKFFDLAEGKADIYPRFAPTMEWDIAAGHAILNALGGVIAEVNTGKELTYNKESLFNPYFIAQTKASLTTQLEKFI